MGPVALLQTGPYPGFQKGAIPVDAVATAHEDSIGESVSRVVHPLLASRALGQETHGEREQNMLGTGTRRGGVGVEVLQRDTLGVAMLLGHCPVHEVLGTAALYGAHATGVGLF